MSTWGGATDNGFTMVPIVFLRSFRKLGLTHAEAMLVIQIESFRYRDQKAFPKVATLVTQLGIGEGTIRKHIRSLRSKGMLRTREMERSQEYDFTPLFKRLEMLVALGEGETPIQKSHRRAYADFGEANKEEENKEENTTGVAITASESDRIARAKARRRKARQRPAEPSLQGSDNPTPLPPSPRRARPDTSWKAEVDRVVQAAGAPRKVKTPKDRKAQRKAARRVVEFKDKPVEAYTVMDMELVLAEVWVERFKTTPSPKFTMKDKGQMRRLMDEYGAESVVKVVQTVVRKWDTFKAEFQIRGAPSVGMFYGYRNSLFVTVLEEEGPEKPKWGSHFNPEKDTRPEGEKTGWGW